MPVERSAGAVIFRREPLSAKKKEGKRRKIFYLFLHYPSGSRTSKDYWDFSKGHIEKGENILKTVRREVFEETGLKDIKFIKGFKGTIKYFFRAQDKTVFKIVIFFLAETKTKDIKISFEHAGFKWLPYKKALEQLTFKNAKEILKKANDYLICQEASKKEYSKR